MISFSKYAVIIFVYLLSQAALAQNGNLSGKLQDAQGAPIAFANVLLLQAADSSMISGTVADAEGKFIMASPVAGAYFLKFTVIGYEPLSTEAFRVSGSGFSRDFGTFHLQEEVKSLEAVVVEALHPIIIREADKMVVSVEGTALAAGSTVMDVLASPGCLEDLCLSASL